MRPSQLLAIYASMHTEHRYTPHGVADDSLSSCSRKEYIFFLFRSLASNSVLSLCREDQQTRNVILLCYVFCPTTKFEFIIQSIFMMLALSFNYHTLLDKHSNTNPRVLPSNAHTEHTPIHTNKISKCILGQFGHTCHSYDSSISLSLSLSFSLTLSHTHIFQLTLASLNWPVCVYSIRSLCDSVAPRFSSADARSKHQIIIEDNGQPTDRIDYYSQTNTFVNWLFRSIDA